MKTFFKIFLFIVGLLVAYAFGWLDWAMEHKTGIAYTAILIWALNKLGYAENEILELKGRVNHLEYQLAQAQKAIENTWDRVTESD